MHIYKNELHFSVIDRKAEDRMIHSCHLA